MSENSDEFLSSLRSSWQQQYCLQHMRLHSLTQAVVSTSAARVPRGADKLRCQQGALSVRVSENSCSMSNLLWVAVHRAVAFLLPWLAASSLEVAWGSTQNWRTSWSTAIQSCRLKCCLSIIQTAMCLHFVAGAKCVVMALTTECELDNVLDKQRPLNFC